MIEAANKFDRKDYWYNPFSEIDFFSSILLEYKNFVRLPASEIHDKKIRIARMIYRNDQTMMEHEREVILEQSRVRFVLCA